MIDFHGGTGTIKDTYQDGSIRQIDVVYPSWEALKVITKFMNINGQHVSRSVFDFGTQHIWLLRKGEPYLNCFDTRKIK